MTINREEVVPRKVRLDLEELNAEALLLVNVKPIEVEVAKAVTLAQSHEDIEARVICTTVSDVYEAVKLVSGRACADLKGAWDRKTRTLELPNGSAVTAKFQVCASKHDKEM